MTINRYFGMGKGKKKATAEEKGAAKEGANKREQIRRKD